MANEGVPGQVMEASFLPELVRRYVGSVLRGPSRSTGNARLAQIGEMVLKPGGRAFRFGAVGELAIDRVAFERRARCPLLGPVGLQVTDSYQPPEGAST
jgi:hypothetical protein